MSAKDYNKDLIILSIRWVTIKLINLKNEKQILDREPRLHLSSLIKTCKETDLPLSDKYWPG